MEYISHIFRPQLIARRCSKRAWRGRHRSFLTKLCEILQLGLNYLQSSTLGLGSVCFPTPQINTGISPIIYPSLRGLLDLQYNANVGTRPTSSKTEVCKFPTFSPSVDDDDEIGKTNRRCLKFLSFSSLSLCHVPLKVPQLRVPTPLQHPPTLVLQTPRKKNSNGNLAISAPFFTRALLMFLFLLLLLLFSAQDGLGTRMGVCSTVWW